MKFRQILRRHRGSNVARAAVLKARSVEELREQLAELGTWMYRFDLGFGIETALHNEYLESIHQTRWNMIEPELQRTFGA